MTPRSSAFLLFCLSVACSGLLAEIVLRWRVGTPVHYRYPQGSYVSDPEIGVWLAPNQRAFGHDKPLVVNSVGIRGPDYESTPPSGTRRVLAIGDSQTFGNGLALHDTWPARLEGALDRQAPGHWEVLNGGLSGTDTWQHVYLLQRLSEAYAFDVAILGFYVNDVVPRSMPGPAEERTNAWPKRIGYVLKRSAVFAFVWQTYQGLWAHRHVGARELHIVNGEPDPQVEKGWAEVERSLVGIQQLCADRGADLFLLVIPRRDQVSGREPATAYNQRIAEIASRHDIPVTDALSALQRAYREHGDDLFIPWDGHNSALSNEIIAEALAPVIAAVPDSRSEISDALRMEWGTYDG